METPYLIEIRTGGDLKQEFRDIIYDVADEFDVRHYAEPRAVPHVPIFGRYDTDNGKTVKRTLVEILSDFDVVPYRISGFGKTESGATVYANVHPSVELVELRDRIAVELNPLTETRSTNQFTFHLPIARCGDSSVDADTVLAYLNDRYDPSFDEYATRITTLRNDSMLWEYDLLQDRVLEHAEATSRESWQRTEALLAEQATPSDHDVLVSEHVRPIIEPLLREGWTYYPDPHHQVTRRARQDGLYRADGSRLQRRLYLGDNYAYLALPSARNEDDIHVLSQEQSILFDQTDESRCPFCGADFREYEGEPVLPCQRCDFQHDLRQGPLDDETLSADHAEMCVRCKHPIVAGGVRFEKRVYCDHCVDTFESVAEEGVIVQSRHGEPDADERPYVVQWDETTLIADGQIEALARGVELADSEGVPGLFIYRRNGSHWLLDAYLDAHPSIKSDVHSKRREIRGEDRVQIDGPSETGTESDTAGHDIRAEGDVFIADTAVKDAVINRADIGGEDDPSEER